MDLIRAKLPQSFISNITNVFGDDGRKWITNVDNIVHACKLRWNLTNIEPVQDLSFNLACFARSPQFGDVVLKIGVPHPELFTEMKAIRRFSGDVMPACYDTDVSRGAMLIERLLPGDDLRSIIDLKERTRIAGQLMHQLRDRFDGDTKTFPHISEWLADAFARARKEGRVSEEMRSFIAQAERLFSELTEQNRRLSKPDTLLHGDLHHYNVLRDKNNWKVIDPKGVVGPKSMEPAAYILNQLEFNQLSERDTISVREMVRIFHEEMDEPEQAIARAVFIFAVLSVTWDYEQEVLPSDAELNAKHEQIRCCLQNLNSY